MCEIGTGRILGCKGTIGGIRRIYVLTHQSNDRVAIIPKNKLTLNATDPKLVDDIDGLFDAYPIDLPPSTGSFTETITTDLAAGTVLFTQAVSIQLHKLGPKTTKLVEDLAFSRGTYVVEDNLGKLHLMGVDHGAEATAGGKQTGTAKAEMSGYMLTLTAECGESAFHLPTAADPANDGPFDGLQTLNITVSTVVIDPATAP